MNIGKIHQYLNVIKRAVRLVEAELDADSNDNSLFEEMLGSSPLLERFPDRLQSVPVVVPPVPEVQTVNLEPSDEWKRLRAKHIQDLMGIDVWPDAVDKYQMQEPTREDQMNRAKCVLDWMLDRPMEELHFLDFGCGDGWVAKEVLERGVASSTGYDIVHSENWDKLADEKLLFTTKLDQLKPHFYDVIFIYDVLDHCEDPVKLMSDIRGLLRQTGHVYVRCHPWTAKHGNHLFKQGINKAYMQLFLTTEEMQRLTGKQPTFTRPEINAVEAYHWWFHDFKVEKERMIEENVSPFFFNPAFKQLLGTEQRIGEKDVDDLLVRMRVQGVDYVLSQKVH